MSLARVKQTKAAKDYVCEKCDEPIKKGDQYLSYKVGFRSRYVHRRHVGCRPRPSELESSMLAEAYAAIEGAEDAIGDAESVEDVVEAVHSAAEGFDSVAQQYEDAYEQVPNYDLEERANQLRDAQGEIESWEPEHDGECAECTEGSVDCDECGGTGQVECDEPECPDCNGDGMVECPDCEGGQVDCDECGGSGADPNAIETIKEEATEFLASVDMP